MKISATYTDLFGGELNYSWVRIKKFEMPEHSTDLQIVRKAKSLLEISGLKDNGNGWNHGENIVRYFRNNTGLEIVIEEY